MKAHAFGLVIGAACGLLLWLAWKWLPLGLFFLVMLSDESARGPGD